MKNHLAVLLISFLCSCSTPISEKTTATTDAKFPDALVKVFDAHGGFSKWSSMQVMIFEMGDEIHTTDLKNRKTRITRDSSVLMGFDGKDVWVTDSSSTESARFYHNLYFYFFAMPFVLGDPGIVYEMVEPKQLIDKTYPGIKIAYLDGVGDSPKDNYVLYYDPETFQMAWLMYTVTFKTQTESNRYGLIKYHEWREVNGLKLPAQLQWFKYQNDTVGEFRNAVFFTNIKIAEEKISNEYFNKPYDAWIAPGPIVLP